MLRSGFLASAASRGASIFKMMDVSRHHLVVALRGYVRDAELAPSACFAVHRTRQTVTRETARAA